MGRLLPFLFILLPIAAGAEPHLTIGGHADFYHLAEQQGLAHWRAPTPSTVPLAEREKILTAEVLGFYPYWSTAEPAELHYDLLSTIAYFGGDLNSAGDFTDLHGWPDGVLIDTAHTHGVRVIFTVICFNSTTITSVLSSTVNRANAVANTVAEVAAAGADGVNVDFEGLPAAQKSNFVKFMQELRAALDAAIEQPYLTVDTPAVDWSGAFDYDQLAAASDHLFIMAYDYHWSGGDPGPVSPLMKSSTWGQYSIQWTLDDYVTYLAPYDLDSVILGLPLYGYDWPTTDSGIPGVARGGADAVFLEEAEQMALDPLYGPQHHDASSDSEYLVYNLAGDGWHQLWYNDSDSLGSRFDYAQTRSTGGIGFWALGYEGQGSGVWDEVKATYYQGPPERCISFQEICDKLYVTYNSATLAYEGHSDNCGGHPYPAYVKVLPDKKWKIFLDYTDQGWPPDCTAGDYGIIDGQYLTGTFKQWQNCQQLPARIVHAKACATDES